jgi:predicted O-methyltransferase YrrM
MSSFLRSIIPFGITSGSIHINVKRWIKNILPTFIVEIIIEKNKAKLYTTDYLFKNYVSDLSENEKWVLLAFLLMLERTKQNVNYLEVGIFAGGTIKFLKQHTKNVHFTGVDLFEDFKQSNDNTHMWENYSMKMVWEVLGKDRVMLYKGNSVETLIRLQKVDRKFGLIFIDGNHTYKATKDDFNSSLPLLEKGGYIAFHNCSPGSSQEDKYYIELDGGPWMVTQELLQGKGFKLVNTTDRIQIFKYL